MLGRFLARTHFVDQSLFVSQSAAGECGLACLAMVANHHGHRTDLATLRRRFSLSARGATLRQLSDIADEMNFHSRSLRCELDSLVHLQLPAILHWDMNHFVVLASIRSGHRKSYGIFDPARGFRSIDVQELSGHFTGIVLELLPTAKFQRGSQLTRLRLTQLWTRLSGLLPALGRVLVLSAVLQLITLATPFYMQLAIDTALPALDVDLLDILALGFVGLLSINAVATWVRARMVLMLSQSIALQTAVNLFRHTIFLPIAWFEKRHLGDVVSRFGSLQPVTDLLSKGLVATAIDGVLAITTLVLMAIYSPALTAITVTVVAVYAAIKVAFFNSAKLSNTNLLAAQALETSAFIENVRGIAAIKMFCQEGNRQRLWQNKKVDTTNMMLKLGRLSAGFDTVNVALVSFENLLLVYVGVKLVMTGGLTLGMLFAYQAYKQSFLGAVTRLVDQVMNYKLLDVHLARIAEIAHETPEDAQCAEPGAPWRSIELRNVCFSYGHGLPLILNNVNLTIASGQTTAIIGSSGAGKTTLLKIICGLLRPISGEVFIDGVPLQHYGVRRYRRQLGVVSQEDTLFQGSLAENITFFDPEYDQDRLIASCREAAIHEDIQAMPMKYDSMVGDMGSNLSGGQKQRVLLARALYRKPVMLCLDEGTAHLDVTTEAQVVSAIRQLGITRVIVAHRPETISTADRILNVVNSRVAEMIPFATTRNERK